MREKLLTKNRKINGRQFPVVVTKDEDGFYVAECAALPGCYSQGKTLTEALKNVREAIALCLETTPMRSAHKLTMNEVSMHTIAV